MSSTGTRLYTKKKAPTREIETPLDVLLYILICRASIHGETTPQSKHEFWKAWLAEKEEKMVSGHAVSRKLRTVYQRDVKDVQYANDKLQAEAKELSRIKQFCAELKIDVNRWTHKRNIESRLAELQAGVPTVVKEHLASAVHQLNRAEEAIKQFEKKNAKTA